MKCLFSSKKASPPFSPKRDEKGKQREGETGGKKREIVSALSANDVGKKEDGRETDGRKCRRRETCNPQEPF